MRKGDQISEIITLALQCQDREAVGGWPVRRCAARSCCRQGWPEARRIADVRARAGSR